MKGLDSFAEVFGVSKE
jgi:hypothetical protein